MLPTCIYFLACIVVIGVVGVVTLAKQPLWALLWTIVVAAVTEAALMTGMCSVPPNPHRNHTNKVFGLGLSRTGTTSLTVALHSQGFSTYHALPHLIDWKNYNASSSVPPVSRYWADAYDAQTDIQSSLVFEELAELYPDAKFVYGFRDPDVWARSMLRFMDKHANLWHCLQAVYDAGLPVPATSLLFTKMYGDWPHHGLAEWRAAFERHDAHVARFFRGSPERLLNISLAGGSNPWPDLAKFLGIPTPEGPWPRADVFEVSARLQPWWQLENALTWFR